MPSAVEAQCLNQGAGREFPGALFVYVYTGSGASLVAQVVKNLPAVLKIRVHSLGWEDPLKKEMATHSGILA